MPYTVSFAPRAEIVTTEFFGRLDACDFIDAVDEMMANRRWRRGMTALWIFHQGVDPSTIDFPTMQNVLAPAMVHRACDWGEDFKIACLIAEPQHVPIFALWRMIPEVQTRDQFRNFDDIKDAMAWLSAPRLVH